MASLDAAVILGFVSDLIFQMKIESAGQRLGYQTVWLDQIASLISAGETGAQQPAGQEKNLDLMGTPGAQQPAGQEKNLDSIDETRTEAKKQTRLKPEEPVDGPGGMLIDQVSQLKPALIIIDLNAASIPWKNLIILLKTSPATRRIPIIGYGSHVEAGVLSAARQAGAQAALPRSRFSADLEAIILEHAKPVDSRALEDACQGELSPTARRGLELFNHGEYFEAHELLETAWNEDSTPAKELYRAILQVAVAYLQIERGNYNGAVKMFWRLRQWIDPLPDECRGVDIGGLRRDALEVYTALTALGRTGIAELDRGLFKPVRYR